MFSHTQAYILNCYNILAHSIIRLQNSAAISLRDGRAIKETKKPLTALQNAAR